MPKRTARKTASTETSNKGFHIQPKNPRQEQALKALRDPRQQLVVLTGCAGSGKTYLAASIAANGYLQGHFDTIVVTRPNISTGKSLGAFPGDVREKMTIWLGPVLSVLKERLGPGKYEYMMEKGKIVLQPLEVIRGASFSNAFILVDEAQNLNTEEMKAISTRIGEGSRLALLGDTAQRDVVDSGLAWFTYIVKKYDLPCPIIKFTSDDVVRSDIVGLLVKAYEKELS